MFTGILNHFREENSVTGRVNSTVCQVAAVYPDVMTVNHGQSAIRIPRLTGIVRRVKTLNATNREPVQIPQLASTVQRRHFVGILAGILVAFLLAIACYGPSLSGPFLFDDIPNLELMGDRGGLTSIESYIEFITSAQAGPIGRPLSLASFALDGQNWPTDPRPFRVTNLILHLVNGLLIFALARLIFSTVHTRTTADKLALICMALWLLHPLLVSTTAYVIQRMAQLSCLFTLAGLITFMHGRKTLSDDPQRGWIWIVAGMGICGALALLSKETGILLPFYALIIELTVFNSVALARHHRTAIIAILCTPLVLLLAYMAVSWQSTILTFEFRPYSMQERLLTQPVVLLDYLRQVLSPQLSGLGLFHDDFPISRGLLDPIVTLASIVMIATLLFLSIWFRRRWPLVSLGILWFFIGHSLEAGPIALEIYFEHRNYLPLLGPVIALCSMLPLLSEKLRRALPAILILVIGMECFLTWQAAATWGSEERFMQTTLVEHPDSLRAQQYVANRLIIQRQFPDALAVQDSLAAKYPEHAGTRMSILNLRCILKVLTAEQVDSTREFLALSRFDRQVIAYFNPFISNAAADTCSVLGFDEVQSIFDSLLRNPAMSKNEILRGATHYHKGIAYKTTGNLPAALRQLDLSYAAKPEFDIRLRQVVWSIEAGQLDNAERYLNLSRQHDNDRAWSGALRTEDIASLQKILDQARDAGM